jgi:DNA repair protein RecO (recombination protein O)
MQADRAEAILLRARPVTESSLLVTWYTREFGKLKTLAKGARRSKSPLRGKLDLFYQDEIVFLRSRRGDLHLLSDCFVVNTHARLRESVASLAAASYVCELVETVTEPEDPDAALFDLLAETLGHLDKQVRAALLLWFEARLLAASGWRPVWKPDTPAGKMLRSITNATAAASLRVKLSEEQLDEARRVLWRFWDAEVARPPRSRALMARLVRR